MRTVVVGGGVVGVTTAYYLASQGHEVTVIEQRSQLGQDATGGNAGLIAPSHAFAWASPQAPAMLLRSLRGERTAIRVKPSLDPRFIGWGLQFLRECTPHRARVNTLAKLALCQYSQRELYRLADEQGIDYDENRLGALYLYRDDEQLELGMRKMGLLAEHGQEIEQLTAEQVVRLDPAFAGAAGTIKGAIHGKGDGTGNSEKFTAGLAEVCETKLGVEFRTGVIATDLVEHRGRITGLRTDDGLCRADNYVIALGIGSPFLSRTVGQNLPVYPAKGYSLTAPITDEKAAPAYGGVDEATLVAWSRMGTFLRVSSTAEFAGYSRQYTPDDFANIFAVARELFPDAADWDKATLRSCMRPMTPDGPPIIGRGHRHENLYYNTGHGHMGWTMACGSSRALADVVLGRRPAIDMAAFKVRSFRR